MIFNKLMRINSLMLRSTPPGVLHGWGDLVVGCLVTISRRGVGVR